MKRITLLLAILASGISASFAQGFARGADISWCTEMEAGGKKFYSAAGAVTDINDLMVQCGMNAVRLRVWVEPTMGGYCTIADVVSKATRAKNAGMDILVDFHYSDFFADPSRQSIPEAWQGSTIDELAQHVADHTTAVLTALKEAGVTPKWAQIGNESRNGMLYSKYNSSSKAWSNIYSSTNPVATGSTSASYGGGWNNYVKLSNAAYDAAKAIFPSILCMPHLDTRGSDTSLNWWFDSFTKAGGKMDMVAFSHYPMPWNSNGETTARSNGLARNTTLVGVIENFHKSYQKYPVMIVETGVYCEYVNGGKDVMQDLFNKCRSLGYVQGIFYWEPEQYNWWKPAIYSTIGWSNYNMCAFLSNGRPSAILDPWKADAEQEAEGIQTVAVPFATSASEYRLNPFITIKNGRKYLAR